MTNLQKYCGTRIAKAISWDRRIACYLRQLSFTISCNLILNEINLSFIVNTKFKLRHPTTDYCCQVLNAYCFYYFTVDNYFCFSLRPSKLQKSFLFQNKRINFRQKKKIFCNLGSYCYAIRTNKNLCKTDDEKISGNIWYAMFSLYK